MRLTTHHRFSRLLSFFLSLGLLGGLLACEPAVLESGDPALPEGPSLHYERPEPQSDLGVGAAHSPQPPEGPAAPAEEPPEGPAAPAEEPPEEPAVEPLSLTITRPERGTREDGRSVQVSGRVQGGRAPTVTVAGQPVQPDPNGFFTATAALQPGLNVLVTEAQDGNKKKHDRRAVLHGATDDPNTEVADGLRAKISEKGLLKVAQLLSTYVSDMDLSGLLPDSGDFEIRELRYDRIEVQLVPLQGKLHVRLIVHNLHVAIRASFRFGVRISVSATADTTRAIIDGDLILAATPQGGLDIELRDPDVTLEGFRYNINNVPGFIEDLFRNWVRGYAEDLLRDTLSDFVIPSLFDPAVLTQTVDLLGVPLQLGLKIRQVHTTPGGIDVQLSGTARAPDAVHPGRAMPATVAPPQAMGNGSHLDIAMQAALIGRILHAAWAGGVLDLKVGPGEAIELPPEVGLPLLRGALGQAAADLPAQTPLRLQTRPLLPLTTHIEDSERPLVIRAGDLLVDFIGGEERLATVALDFTARLTFDVQTGDSLSLEPDFAIEAFANVADQPRGPVNEGVLETLMAGFANALPGLVANQTFSLATDFLPVPLRLSAPDVEAEPEGGWLHIRTNLQ